jgi:hypothetical protein
MWITSGLSPVLSRRKSVVTFRRKIGFGAEQTASFGRGSAKSQLLSTSFSEPRPQGVVFCVPSKQFCAGK